MSWSPIKFFHDNDLLAATIAADYEDANYPIENLLDRVDGTLWKSTSQLAQKVKHEGVSITADYLALYNHNLSGSMISLEHDSTIDDFANSSLAATWGTSVAASGTVVETTSLAITSAAANDAAILKEAATYSKTAPRRIRTRSKITTAGVSNFFQGLAYRTTVAAQATFDADLLCGCYQTSAGKIRAMYYDTVAAAFKYYDAGTAAWNTTSTNDLYAGALDTQYYVELVNDGSRFRFLVYLQSSGALLAKTTWVAFSAARASGTGNLTWFCGDPYNDAGTCAMTVYLAELWSAAFIEDLTDNKAHLKTFTEATKSNWYLYIVPNAVTPFIGILQLGSSVELDYADTLTPRNQELKASVNVGETGYLQGIHDKFAERELTIGFLDVDDTLWTKIETWWDAVGLGLFGVQWDPGDHSTQFWMMRNKDGKRSAPLKRGGAYCDVTISLVGRKE